MKTLGMPKLLLALVLGCLTVTAAPINVLAQQPYWNEPHLFVITCPSGWTINEKAANVTVQFEARVANISVAVVKVIVFTYVGFTLADVISSVKKVSLRFREFNLLSEHPVKVADIEGYEIVCTFKQDDTTFKEKLVILRRDGYKFYLLDYLAAEMNYDRYRTDADRSIGSFRFTEKLTLDAEPRVASVTVDQTTYSAKDLPKAIFFVAGSEVSFSVTSPVPESGLMGTLGARAVFDRWSGDLSASTPTATIKMDGPKTVTAIWKTDYTSAYITLGAIVLVVVLVILGGVVVVRRKAAPPPRRALRRRQGQKSR
nr:hypothetical protein [Candidatus Njordarchaeum guaymaensis]